MSKFVLVGTQRSGTTLVRSALGSHPEILCLGEVFLLNKTARMQGGPMMGKDLSAGFSSWRELNYQRYLERSMVRQLGHWLFRGGVTRRYLDELYATPGYQAIGFKLMANQIRKFPAVLPYIENNGIRVVHVLRENPFDILLSRLALYARGYAHSASQAGEAVTIHIPTGNLIEQLRTIRDEGMQWKNMFEGRVPYMMVTYDRFVRDRDAVSPELLSFLGVDPHVELKSELVKLNTAPVSEMVQNFEDVSACLRATEFAWCIS